MNTLKRKIIISNFLGNIFETYDLLIYGILAPYISQAFFGTHNKNGIFYTFLVLFVGYLARPVGAIFFGFIADKNGRKNAVVLSVLFVSIFTAAIGMLPTYKEVGAAAPYLLLACRLIQSLALGGEYTNSIVFLVEHSNGIDSRYTGSWATNGSSTGFLLASAVGFLTSVYISHSETHLWAWRIPFIASLMGIALSIWMDRKTNETLPFIRSHSSEPVAKIGNHFKSLINQIKRNPKRFLLISILLWLCVTLTYLVFVYSPTHISQDKSIPLSMALASNSASLVFVVILTPMFGRVSDKLGARKLLTTALLIVSVFAYPFFWASTHGNYMITIIFHLILATGTAMLYGIVPVLMIQSIDVKSRGFSAAIIYNMIACTLGGGAPIISILLTKATGISESPALYLSFVSLTAIISLQLLKSHLGKGANK